MQPAMDLSLKVFPNELIFNIILNAQIQDHEKLFICEFLLIIQ